MKNSIQSKVIILLLSLFRTGFSENGSKVKVAVKRSYQIPHVALVNDPQGLQYYAAGPLYTIPTVLIPNQIGLSATPITNMVLQPSSDPKPTQEFQETSTPVHTNIKPAKISTFYKQKQRSHGFVQTNKRPTSYVNSVYGHPIRMKPLSSIPSHKIKVSSLSIQPSVDLSGQFNQEAATNLYQSTVGPPVVSTYGPPKAVDFQYKTRVSGAGGQAVYHKLKGPSHRHTYYPTKKMRVYSHVHKDHIHNHYIPTSHPIPTYKTQHPPKYFGPAYLPPAPSTPPTYTQETTPNYSYQTNTQVRFPENQETIHHSLKEQTEVHKPNYSPGEVTQAIIKNPGVINNYDANIPLHVPSKKPYQFEVNEILKNSELHFVQEAQPENKNNEQINTQNGLLHYNQKVPYQNPLVFGSQQLYTPLTVDQSNIIGSNPLDIYTLPGVNTYQTNHIVADQDLGTSETVRVPVAVIRGAHNIASQGMFGFTVKRQDETAPTGEEIKKTFTPSKRTSDWIPMSGNGVPLITNNNPSEKQSDTSIETISDGYYSPSSQTSRKDTKIIRQPVGDIISGKIPEKYSPKTGRDGEIVNGKVSFVRSSSGEREKRKGSVIDVYPSAGSAGDTSDLVVSSVIKFS